jgi:hypothetical protein
MTHFKRPIAGWMVMLVLVSLLAGCNLPTGAPDAATAQPTQPPPAATILPARPDNQASAEPDTALPPTATISQTAPSATVTVASPTAELKATPSPAPLDRKDAKALIAALSTALERKDSSFFERMLADHPAYINYIEGGQPIEPAQVVSDLKTRLAASSPTCTQYGTYERTLQIWTSGWSPDWQIDKTCYQDCNPVNPPFKSHTAAFFFNPKTDGSYELSAVWLNDDSLWRSVYQVQMHACSEPYQAPAAALVCPGAPATRLAVNSYATVSTETITANRVRSAAGTSAAMVGLLPPGQVVQIVDGPTCQDGYVWWKVKAQTGELTGWTAEGQGKEYWLVPCGGGDKCGK